MRLRQIIGPTKKDQEFCVGDFLNKGPASQEVLRFLQKSSIRSVRGNHEDRFLRYHQNRRFTCNRVQLKEEELKLYHTLSLKDFDYLASLPIAIFLDHLTIVHAGVLPSTNLRALDKKEAAKVMRVRYLDEEGRFVHLDDSDPSLHFWWSEFYDGRYGKIVYGHQPFVVPRVDRWSFGIDTGAVYGNFLTAIVFEDDFSFVSVPSKAYAKKEAMWILPNL